jgi:hypothetical protein
MSNLALSEEMVRDDRQGMLDAYRSRPKQLARWLPPHFHHLLLFKFAKGSHDPNGPRPHPAQDFSQLVEK